ncbi:drug/metabolite transporter (DMT)-like permease [Novosphingobium hassiacum]|uniref:Drug/metabolite transporter (DMT)-like permease n=2 Tax=Novosphingobium hassiacum TaxID=173676 RepID=A0A7W5ZUW1_9SPHN|nr:drug/metabolite transporter (DMT)-like permease [Novosphingobium hassiacum]
MRCHRSCSKIAERGKMTGAHPFLGLVACFFYIGVSFAALSAWRLSERPDDRLRWGLVAAFFVMLAILRGSGLEAAATSAMRDAFMQDGLYEQRRDVQRPLAALAVVLISGALALFYFKRPRSQGKRGVGRREWPRFWAMVGVILMCGVVLMRLISFHELDRYLYGPVRANWILDVGSSAIVVLAAFRFRQASREPVSPPGRQKR